MMRIGTLMWLGLAFAASGMLFHFSSQVRDLNGELGMVNSQIQAEQEAIRVLRAEWTFLSRPDRLRELARELTPLGPAQTHQIIADIEAIPMPLPAPGTTIPIDMANLPGMDRLPLPPHKPAEGGSSPAVAGRMPVPSQAAAQAANPVDLLLADLRGPAAVRPH